MLTLNKILEILKKFKAEKDKDYGIEQLGVFGSYARGEQNEKSDIDVCIKIKHGGIFVFEKIKDELEMILKSKIDLVSQGSIMQPNFKSSLEQDTIFV